MDRVYPYAVRRGPSSRLETLDKRVTAISQGQSRPRAREMGLVDRRDAFQRSQRGRAAKLWLAILPDRVDHIAYAPDRLASFPEIVPDAKALRVYRRPFPLRRIGREGDIEGAVPQLVNIVKV